METVDVSGGTIAMMIESLARFNNLTLDVEKEKRMATCPIHNDALLRGHSPVATTIMMLNFTSTTITVGGSAPK